MVFTCNLENILQQVTCNKIDDKSNASDYDSTDSQTNQALITNDDQNQAYKSLSKITNHENNIITMIQDKEEKEEEEEEEEEMVDDRLKKFGNVKVAILTKSMGGKSIGDILLLKDIIKQFEKVIKQHARIKLIKSYASKKIKVNEFKSRDEIQGLLELIISCVIKLKYKDNVTFDKTKRKLELSEFVEWIVNDADTMNGESWNVDRFANVFDDWICQIIDN